MTRVPTAEPEPVVLWTSGGYELAEGARWIDDRLVYVDILTGRLFETSGTQPEAARLLAQVDAPLGAVAAVAGGSEEWIVAAGTGIAILDGTGRLRWVDRPEDHATVLMRMNDGACDPHGRFWAGSMAYDNTPGVASLYRVDVDGTVTRVLDGMTIVNGPAFDPDGSGMYVTDSAAGRIYHCSIDVPSGDITEQHVFAAIPSSQGTPDGMTLDDAGRLWVAMWNGFAVRCYNPDGSLHDVVNLRCPQPTSVCIGGSTGDRLFVTTARHGLQEPTPRSGAILSTIIDATAPPAAAFGHPTTPQ